MIDLQQPDRVTYPEAYRYFSSVPPDAPVCSDPKITMAVAVACTDIRGWGKKAHEDGGLVWMGICPICKKTYWEWLQEAERIETT